MHYTRELDQFIYSYFEKGCRKKCAVDNPERKYGIRSIHCSWLCPSFCCLTCHSFKFLWRTVNLKSPTIPFGIVGCTFSDNLSRNSCILITFWSRQLLFFVFDWKRKISTWSFFLYSFRHILFFHRITGERDKEVVFRDSTSSWMRSGN